MGVTRQPGSRGRVMRSGVLTMVVLVGAMSAGGCSYGGGGSLVSTSGGGIVDEIAPGERQRLPMFSGTTLSGDSFNTRDAAGRVLVVNVWGSWCAPCRAEAPALKKISDEYTEQGVVFVGIDVRDNDASAVAFERNYGITYPSISTESSVEAMLAVGDVLPRNAVPSTLVVDASGRVAGRVVGGSTYETLKDLIESASEPGGPRPSPASQSPP